MPWVPLVVAAAVAPGGVTAVDAGGLELVVWRTRSGVAAVCDARCPHQWSHLAEVGAVDGDELVCTTHFWRFDLEGGGTKLNVKGRRDQKGPIASVECRERNGRIEAWLPAGGGATEVG